MDNGYDYIRSCNRTAIVAKMIELQVAAEAKVNQASQHAAEQLEVERDLQSYADWGKIVIEATSNLIKEAVLPYLLEIVDLLKQKSVCCGSFPSRFIADALFLCLQKICHRHFWNYPPVKLLANDIDVYYCDEASSRDGVPFQIDPARIEYFELDDKI